MCMYVHMDFHVFRYVSVWPLIFMSHVLHHHLCTRDFLGVPVASLCSHQAHKGLPLCGRLSCGLALLGSMPGFLNPVHSPLPAPAACFVHWWIAGMHTLSEGSCGPFAHACTLPLPFTACPPLAPLCHYDTVGAYSPPHVITSWWTAPAGSDHSAYVQASPLLYRVAFLLLQTLTLSIYVQLRGSFHR